MQSRGDAVISQPTGTTIMQRNSVLRFSAIAATLTLAAASSFATQNFGEAFPYEQAMASSAGMAEPKAMPESMTARQDVRDEYIAAKEAGALTKFGEAGDSEYVIAARDRMNVQQVVVAERVRAENEEIAAMQQAEELRAQIEATSEPTLVMSENGDLYEVYSVYLIESGE